MTQKPAAMIDLENICHRVCRLAEEVGLFITSEKNKINADVIEEKGLNNFVTYVDKTSEQKIVAALQGILPEAGFKTEEETNITVGDQYNWIIDPLDGTTNFIHGIPNYCISIALMRSEKVVLGVVYEVNLKENFYAWENSPVYLNGKEISVSKAAALKDSLLATGFPYHDYARLNEYLLLFKMLIKNTHGIRRLGSAALDLAYVACGRFEGFYEYGLNSWDVAAGTFLVERAGGKVSDFKGGDDYIFGKEVVATNELIFDEFLGVVKKYMNKKLRFF